MQKGGILPKTKTVTSYPVLCTLKSNSFAFPVNLLDFPGELLYGITSSADISTYYQVHEQLSLCDAYIVLLDAEHLTLNSSVSSLAQKTSAEDIAMHLRHATARRAQTDVTAYGIPIVFAISKFDIFERTRIDGDEAVNAAYQCIRQLFAEFFAPQSKHPVMITGVSVGPIDLRGSYSPLNIITPFAFCLSMLSLSVCAVNSSAAASVNSTRDSIERRLAQRRRKNVIERALDSLFDDEPTIAMLEGQSKFFGERADTHYNTATHLLTLGEAALNEIQQEEMYRYSRIVYNGNIHNLTFNPRMGQMPLGAR